MLLHELLLIAAPPFQSGSFPSRIALMRAGQSWALWSSALNWNVGVSVAEEDFDGIGPSFPRKIKNRVCGFHVFVCFRNKDF